MIWEECYGLVWPRTLSICSINSNCSSISFCIVCHIPLSAIYLASPTERHDTFLLSFMIFSSDFFRVFFFRFSLFHRMCVCHRCRIQYDDIVITLSTQITAGQRVVFATSPTERHDTLYFIVVLISSGFCLFCFLCSLECVHRPCRIQHDRTALHCCLRTLLTSEHCIGGVVLWPQGLYVSL